MLSPENLNVNRLNTSGDIFQDGEYAKPGGALKAGYSILDQPVLNGELDETFRKLASWFSGEGRGKPQGRCLASPWLCICLHLVATSNGTDSFLKLSS